MHHLKTVILIAVLASPVFSKPSSEIKPKSTLKDLFGIWNEITEGIMNFANLITSIRDVFSIISEDGSVLNIENIPTPPDTFLNITELANKYGYPMEEYKVVTEDGYILTIHRLKAKNTPNGKVVFLMHGILDSSDSWVIQGPDNALGYILADNGFDVWMGNARGNKHALAHTTLDPKESDFWEFTWEEIGLYDLPAMIDYVLNATGNENLYYVGYSQGTTSFYVMSSMKPEYNEKVKLMFSLAPIAWMGNVKSPIVRMFSPASKLLGYIISNFNTKSPSTDFFNKMSAVFCGYLPISCENFLYMIEGYEHKNINSTLLPVILGHMPTGASTIQFVHYGQLVQSGKFARFDFDAKRNLKEYGQYIPPNYNITKITVPIEMFYSDSDWLSDRADVEILRNNLPNVVGYNYIEGFNHLDYSYASRAKDEVYKQIMVKIENDQQKYT